MKETLFSCGLVEDRTFHAPHLNMFVNSVQTAAIRLVSVWSRE